jgi:hypothetical protein
MKKEHLSFDIFPCIVRADSEAIVTIRPLFDHCRFTDGQTYRVRLIPAEGLPGEVRWPENQPMALTPQNGALHVPCRFGPEQEYVLAVNRDSDEPGSPPLAEFRLYALDGDLFARRPYKGDTHLHTHHSDGKESPAYVAASGRKIGMDFLAITDHGRHFPSLEAIAAFQGVPTDLRIYPGEEVHPPDNRVHMVNFGGAFSVNELFWQDSYLPEVQALAETLTHLPEGVERYQFASCTWVFEKIRQGGGLGIFCHPYWYSRQRYDVPHTITDLLFEHQPYDALELIGGYFRHEIESNTLQVARYHEERARGKRIPIVGVSDAHGCETGNLFGWYYTIVFSPSTDLPDLIANIKNLNSVAVEALPGETVRAYGPFRLVRYAQFLLREILPLHDELCQEEGRLLLTHAAGDVHAVEALRPLQGRVARLYDHLWQT